MATKSDYFYDVATGWSDASEYTHRLLGLEDESVAVFSGLESLGYREEYNPVFNVGTVEIKVYSNINGKEYAYVLHIDDGVDISVVFTRNAISMRACLSELVSNVKVYNSNKEGS